MTLLQAKTIFTPQFLQQIDNVLINGNYGDFITARDGLAIVEYFKETNPKLRIEISTNASGRPNWWTRLGELGVTVDFRIDGLADTHHLYRQYTDFNLILENAKKFISAGGRAVWAWIPFDHNVHQRESAETLANDMGFAHFWVADAGRNVGPVFNREGKLSHVLGDYRDSTDFDELYAQHVYYTDLPEITLTETVTKPIIDCHAKNNNEIYITATGEVYPCCWLGFYPRNNTGNPSNVQLRKILENNNANEIGIENAINWFIKIEESWKIDSIKEGRIYSCNETCGKCA
jgi:sulfatase maturation enzyme AslB (radical SAM superfamily)